MKASWSALEASSGGIASIFSPVFEKKRAISATVPSHGHAQSHHCLGLVWTFLMKEAEVVLAVDQRQVTRGGLVIGVFSLIQAGLDLESKAEGVAAEQPHPVFFLGAGLVFTIHHAGVGADRVACATASRQNRRASPPMKM